MSKWPILLLAAVMGSCGDVLCAKGMSMAGELHGFGPFSVARTIRFIADRKLVILGVICYAVAYFSLLALLRVAQLSVAVPALALGFIFDTLGARFFLHEHVSGRRWLGVLFVAAGVLLAVG